MISMLVFLIKDSFKSIVSDPGYIGLYLLPMIVSIISSVIMWFVIGIDFQSIISQNVQNPQAASTLLMKELMDKIWIILALGILSLIVYMLVATISTAGIIKKAVVQQSNGYMNFSEALSFGLKAFPRLFGAYLVAIPIIGWFFFLIIGFSLLMVFTKVNEICCLSIIISIVLLFVWLYMFLRFSLFPHVCVIEGDGPIKCFKRSWQISKGHVLLIFVAFLILFIIAIAINIPAIILGYSTIAYISSIYGLITSIFLGPFFVIVFTLLYLKISGKQKRTGMTESNPTDLSSNSFSSRV